MENETIKQNNLVTYLALTISCSCLKLFQYKKLCMSSHLQESWKTDQFQCNILVATTFMLSWIHEFMNSWIHEFMTHQGACKSGDAKFR